MSEVLFPAGLSIDFRDVNLEEMEFHARAWNLQRVQMQKGLFIGSMMSVHTPRMQLMRAPYSHGVLLQGDFPKGTILIACVVTDTDVTFQNEIAKQYEIKILKSGDEIDFLSNGKSETFTISVAEKFFYESYNTYFGTDFSSYSKSKKVYVNPQLFTFFTQGIAQWINYLMQDHDPLKIALHYERIESEILEHVFSCIYLEDNQKPRQKFQIKKARDLLHESIGDENKIVNLSAELGISESLLQHAFKANYGITPKRYLLNLRMHSVKHSLLSADPHTTITSIIEEYSFYNQNTFTQAYKVMFGELPSVILRKSL